MISFNCITEVIIMFLIKLSNALKQMKREGVLKQQKQYIEVYLFSVILKNYEMR